jgi:hypothetical protein
VAREPVIAAAALMCAIQYGLPLRPCLTQGARQIAIAIDAATDDDGLKAHLVVYAWHESHFRLQPLKPGGRGPWRTGDEPLWLQARRWLWRVERSGPTAVYNAPYRRAVEAQRLLEVLG